MKLLQYKFLVGSLLASSIVMAPVAMANSSEKALQLKTSVEEVNGVREIEAGDYPAGIRKTEAALDVTAIDSRRAPLLNNLCVAHIATGNTDAALKTCDDAVESANNKAIALNNRAILKCANGEPAACHQDLKQASNIASHNRVIRNNFTLVAKNALVVSQ